MERPVDSRIIVKRCIVVGRGSKLKCAIDVCLRDGGLVGAVEYKLRLNVSAENRIADLLAVSNNRSPNFALTLVASIYPRTLRSG